MKLSLFFMLIDTILLLSYPVLYIASRLRKKWKVKR